MSVAKSTSAKPTVPPAAAHAEAGSFATLTEKIDYLSQEDLAQVRRAYRYADQAHLGQFRKNGEPYITHPIAVAAQCAEWKLDAQALCAALLHDAMEDCGITKTDLIERFGVQVADLVDGLTKLEKLEFTTREENQAESFRKMLLAMAQDVRVILVKLADRSHNMRTMGDMPRSKWDRISRETLEIYVPIAHRLGLNQTYRELQELAFQHLWPWRHKVLSKAVQKSRNRRRDLMQRVQHEVEIGFEKAGLKVRLSGREKNLFSIYNKMDIKHLSFAQITDIYGFRVILPTAVDCYTALGVLHQTYKPVPDKFKDHIAIPKLNGYQSLHTTVVGPSGLNVEFQMRTEAMHLVAEAGVAAHWLYKTNGSGHANDTWNNKWLQSLLDIQDETRDATEFWDHVKVDLFPDAVYVFTPKSRIMAMPNGATVVDFAYAVHSDVGDRALAAKINGQQVPLRTELRNGDVVEIITSSVAAPNPAWLGFVRTGRARSKIRHHLKTMALPQSKDLGYKLLAQALRAEGISDMPAFDSNNQGLWDKLLRFTASKTQDELLIDIGLGRRVANIVAKRLATMLAETGHKPDALLISQTRFTAHETLSQGGVVIDGSESTSVQFAACCRPIPGDQILGYLGRGEGLVIHTESCAVAQRLKHKDSERFLTVAWAEEPTRAFDAGIVVTVTNGKGVLARVASAITSSEADISVVNMHEEGARRSEAAELRFVITVRDTAHLDSVLGNLRRVPSVLSAQRSVPAAG